MPPSLSRPPSAALNVTRLQQKGERDRHKNTIVDDDDDDDDSITRDAVDQLESELREQKERLEIARTKLRRRGQNEQIRTRERLQQQLVQVDTTIADAHRDRVGLRDEVVQHQIKFAELREREQTQQRQLDLVQKQKHMDLLRYVEIEMFQLREHQGALQRLTLQRAAQLNAITDELEHRKTHDVDELSYLLKRADVLQQYANDDEVGERKQHMIELLHPVEGTEGAVRLVDEVLAHRERIAAKAAVDSAEHDRAINEKRASMVALQRQVHERRRRHRAILRHGLDVLEAVELGNAPPIDIIADDRHDRDDDDISINVNASLDEEAGRIEKSLEEQKKRLLCLQDQFERSQVRLQVLRPASAYRNELGKHSYEREQLPTVQMVRNMLVRDILPKIVKRIVATHLEEEDIDALARSVQQQKQEIERDDNARQIRLAAFAVWHQLVIKTVEECVLDVVECAVSEREIMRSTAFSALLKAVQGDMDAQRRALDGLVKQRNRTADKGRMRHSNIVRSLQEIEDSKAKKLKQEKENAAERKAASGWFGISKKRNKKPESDNDAADKAEKEHDTKEHDREERLQIDDNIGVVELTFAERPSPDVSALQVLETLFWATATNQRSSIRSMSKGIVDVAIDDDARHLVGAGNDGSLQVWLLKPTPMLIRLATKSKARWTRVCLAGSHARTIATLDEEGGLHIWEAGAGITMDKAATKAAKEVVNDKEDIPFVRMVQPKFRIVQADLERSLWSDRDDHEMEPLSMKPTVVLFHPCVRFDLGHPSVMIGTESGLALRWNLQACAKDTKGIIYGHSIATREPPLPKASRMSTPTNFIRREYFQAHMTELILVGFIGNGADLITLDSSCYANIWVYDDDAFSGFDWVSPRYRYAVDLSEKVFRRQNDHVNVMFPPVGLDTDSANECANTYYEIVRDRLKNELYEEPHTVEHDGELVVTLMRSKNALRLHENGKKIGKEFWMHSFTHNAQGHLQQHSHVKHMRNSRHGQLLEAKMSANNHDLIMLVFYNGSANTSFPKAKLCFRMASISRLNDRWDMHMTNICIALDLQSESVPEEMPLWTSYTVLDPPGSDYLFVYHNRSLRVYSLTSGAYVYGMHGHADPTLKPSSLQVFGRPPQVVLSHSNSPTLHFWNVKFELTEQLREQCLQMNARQQSYRISLTPYHHRVLPFSPHFGFGYNVLDRIDAFADYKQGIRKMLLEMANCVVDEKPWTPLEPSELQKEARPWPDEEQRALDKKAKEEEQKAKEKAESTGGSGVKEGEEDSEKEAEGDDSKHDREGEDSDGEANDAVEEDKIGEEEEEEEKEVVPQKRGFFGSFTASFTRNKTKFKSSPKSVKKRNSRAPSVPMEKVVEE